MLLVALPQSTGEALAASAVLAPTRGYSSAALALVCGHKAAPWFEEAPRRFWTVALGVPETAALTRRKEWELQWRLYRRLAPCAISGLLDLGPYPALSALPACQVLRVTRKFQRRVPPLWFRRQKGEAIEQALARFHGKALHELGESHEAMRGAWSPARFGVATAAQNARHDRRAAELLPGGTTRPWVAVAPCFGSASGDTPFSLAFCAQVCEALLFAGGALPEGRVAVLSSPGEGRVAEKVAANFAEILGSERVANLAARTGLALAGAALARASLLLSANRTATQLAAAAQVPSLVIERGGGLPEVPLPLWAGQETLSLPVADEDLAGRFHSLLPVD